MVPLLENYAIAGILLTAVILFVIFFAGLLSGSPLTMVLVIAFAMMPVAGVIEQALVGKLALSLAVGVAVGTLVGFISSAFFPDRTAPTASANPTRPGRAAAAWIALRATVIVMPVFVLALTDPSFYLAAIMKTVTLSQQAGETDARSAGKELVGSTLMGAFVAVGIWLGLSLWPSLWMLVLWLMAAALWVGSAMTGARSSRFRPSFWSNALITALILIGPAIEDSVSSKASSKARSCARVSSSSSPSMLGAPSCCSSVGVPDGYLRPGPKPHRRSTCMILANFPVGLQPYWPASPSRSSSPPGACATTCARCAG
jgi:hypothetical protein